MMLEKLSSVVTGVKWALMVNCSRAGLIRSKGALRLSTGPNLIFSSRSATPRQQERSSMFK